MMRRKPVNEESSVPQSSQTRQTNATEPRLPGREQIEDWLREIRDVSSEILDELRDVTAGEESVEQRDCESFGECGTSEHRLAALKQRLTERLQETSDGAEASPAGKFDQRHPVLERSSESQRHPDDDHSVLPSM